LEEKKRFSELQKKFKEEKRNYDQQKEDILSDIDEVRQNIIIGKSKNSIHEKKIAEYMKKIIELNNRRDYILSVYSGASENSVSHSNNQQHSASIFCDDTFQMKSNHERNKSSSNQINPNNLNNQMFGHSKEDQENVKNEIQMEKNKIKFMEKDLENLKSLEYIFRNKSFNF